MVSNSGNRDRFLLCQHTLSWKHQHSIPQGGYIDSLTEKYNDEELQQLLFIEPNYMPAMLDDHTHIPPT